MFWRKAENTPMIEAHTGTFTVGFCFIWHMPFSLFHPLYFVARTTKLWISVFRSVSFGVAWHIICDHCSMPILKALLLHITVNEIIYQKKDIASAHLRLAIPYNLSISNCMQFTSSRSCTLQACQHGVYLEVICVSCPYRPYCRYGEVRMLGHSLEPKRVGKGSIVPPLPSI